MKIYLLSIGNTGRGVLAVMAFLNPTGKIGYGLNIKCSAIRDLLTR